MFRSVDENIALERPNQLRKSFNGLFVFLNLITVPLDAFS